MQNRRGGSAAVQGHGDRVKGQQFDQTGTMGSYAPKQQGNYNPHGSDSFTPVYSQPGGPSQRRIDVGGIFDDAKAGISDMADAARLEGTTAIQRAQEQAEDQTRDTIAAVGGQGRGGVVQQQFGNVAAATVDAQGRLEQSIAVDTMRANFEIDKQKALVEYEDELRIANWNEEERRVGRDIENAFLTMQFEADMQKQLMEFGYDLENEWSWGDLAGGILEVAGAGFDMYANFQTAGAYGALKSVVS